MITDYHAVYYVHELHRVGGSGVDRLSRALFDVEDEIAEKRDQLIKGLEKRMQQKTTVTIAPAGKCHDSCSS